MPKNFQVEEPYRPPYITCTPEIVTIDLTEGDFYEGFLFLLFDENRNKFVYFKTS